MARHRAEKAHEMPRRSAGGVRRAVTPALGTVAAVATVVSVAPTGGPGVDLAALVYEGSSTNPTGEGIPEFYDGLFEPPVGEPTVAVNFVTGPFGVYDALHSPSVILGGADDVVLSSGWGAANISLLLSYMKALDALGIPADPALTAPVYVLDNNVARPNGGFGTRYPIFGIIGVNPIPTPSDPGAQVIDVGYEYDINGNTPAYVLNVVSMANSLATYFDNRLNQSTVTLPVNPDGSLDPDACDPACPAELADGEEIVTTVDGKTVVIKRVADTTYISYRTDGLPLLEPLRQYGGETGQRIAYIVEPALTAVVNYGYPDNDALANPERYAPARLLPTPEETRVFLDNFEQGVVEGIDRIDDDLPADDELLRVDSASAAGESDEDGQAEGDDADQRTTSSRWRPGQRLRDAVRSWQRNDRGEIGEDDDSDAADDDDEATPSDDGATPDDDSDGDTPDAD